MAFLTLAPVLRPGRQLSTCRPTSASSISRRVRACVSPLPTSLPSASASSRALPDRLPAGVTAHTWTWPGHGTVRYLEAPPTGAPTGATVVFVHGFGTSSRDFLANLPAAAAAGHRALAFDFLGLGGSAPADAAVAARVGVAVWRDQLAAALDAVAPGRVYLVGNSLGGLVAAAVAAARPRRVAGCVLLSPAPFWATLPRNRASLALLRVFWGRLTRRAVVEDTLRLVYADGAKVPPAAVEEILAPTAQPYAQAVFEAVLTRGAGELSAGFECIVREAFSEGGGGVPLAIVYGREDPWVVPLFGLRVKGIVPGCAHFELSPCGHCAHAEAPVAVNAIVERWVRDVDGGGDGHGLVVDGEVLEGVRVSVRDGSAGNIFERLAGSSNFGTVFLAAYASSWFAAAGSTTER